MQEGITIADCSLPDMPLIYANAGFVRTTGYSAAYVLGKNCRCGRAVASDSDSCRERNGSENAAKALIIEC